MNSFHAFILPSIFQRFGLVIQEVCLYGLLIITTNRNGSTNYFLMNKFNGLLINIRKEHLGKITYAINKSR